MLMRRSLRLRLLAWIATAAIGVSAAGNAAAADCGCETPCDCHPMEVAAGCDGGCCDGRAGGLSHGLRRFHDRLKDLCDWKWHGWKLGGHRDGCCDDACDRLPMEDVMFSSPHVMHHHGHVAPHPHRSSQGTHGMHSEVPMPPSEPGVISPPVHMHEEKTDAELFETLPDPFQDDEAKLQTQSNIRPSSHQASSRHDEVILRPVPRRPLSTSQQVSSRRAKSSR